MQILLLLSAMLAGLTGLISGDRVVEPRHMEQALSATSALVEAAPAILHETAVATASVIPATAVPVVARAFFPAAPTVLTGRAPVDERRLE